MIENKFRTVILIYFRGTVEELLLLPKIVYAHYIIVYVMQDVGTVRIRC